MKQSAQPTGLPDHHMPHANKIFHMRSLIVLISMTISACGITTRHETPSILLADPPRPESIDAMIEVLPMGGQNIVRKLIASGPESSLFLVRIDDREQPHRHTKYDLFIVVVDGLGTLWIEDVPLDMKRGDTAHIPRGTPHYFVNCGSRPASALATFSPRFAGPDSESVDP